MACNGKSLFYRVKMIKKRWFPQAYNTSTKVALMKKEKKNSLLHHFAFWVPVTCCFVREPMRTNPGRKSGISVCELAWSPLSKKKNKKEEKKKGTGGEWIVQHSPKILTSEEKSTNLLFKKKEKNRWLLYHANLSLKKTQCTSSHTYTHAQSLCNMKNMVPPRFVGKLVEKGRLWADLWTKSKRR